MTPMQEVEVHTSENVFYMLRIIPLSGEDSFLAEITLRDSEFVIPFTSDIKFPKPSPDAEAAFRQALTWTNTHASKHGYNITRINNPHNCEFIETSTQDNVLLMLGIKNIRVEVNGT